MPYKLVKVQNNPPLYAVENILNGYRHSFHTTLKKAKAQIRLLHSLGY